MFWHGNPVIAVEWFRKTWPERYERILSIFNAGGKIRVQDKYAELKGNL
jgi:hypothetical protein